MKQADFMFTVGYNGIEAIVNKQTEQDGKNLSVKEFCSLHRAIATYYWP